MAAGTANDSLLQDARRLARPTTMAEVVATTTGAAKNEEAASKSVSLAQASSAGVTAIDGKVNTCDHGCGIAEQEDDRPGNQYRRWWRSAPFLAGDYG
ncbi:hypothetical protein NKI20_25475 [Mesorhizobium sp. M0830]